MPIFRAGHVARMEEGRSAFKILTGKGTFFTGATVAIIAE